MLMFNFIFDLDIQMYQNMNQREKDQTALKIPTKDNIEPQHTCIIKRKRISITFPMKLLRSVNWYSRATVLAYILCCNC